MNTNTLPTRIPIDDGLLEIMARSGAYLAELEDGRIVDLEEYYYGGGQELGNIWDKVRGVFKKPLKLVGILAGVGVLANVAGVGGILGNLGTAVSKIGTQIASITKTSAWTTINRTGRVILQASGILPTKDNVGWLVQNAIDEKLASEGYYDENYNPYLTTTAGTFNIQQYYPLLVLLLGSLLIYYIMKGKK